MVILLSEYCLCFIGIDLTDLFQGVELCMRDGYHKCRNQHLNSQGVVLSSEVQCRIRSTPPRARV